MHILQIECSIWLKTVTLKKDASELEKDLFKCENFILLYVGA